MYILTSKKESYVLLFYKFPDQIYDNAYEANVILLDKDMFIWNGKMIFKTEELNSIRENNLLEMLYG